jgi:threonyl-tRNA synthetase
MIALLIEHWEGKFPLWLSPTQILIIPIKHDSEKQLEYATKLSRRLKLLEFHVETDFSKDAFVKKIARSRTLYNYILTVGDREVLQETVSVRPRSDSKVLVKKIDLFIEHLQKERAIE